MERPINFINTIMGLNIFKNLFLQVTTYTFFLKKLLNIFVFLLNDLVFLLKKPIISILILKKTC
jgi:hypothetical protein